MCDRANSVAHPVVTAHVPGADVEPIAVGRVKMKGQQRETVSDRAEGVANRALTVHIPSADVWPVVEEIEMKMKARH